MPDNNTAESPLSAVPKKAVGAMQSYLARHRVSRLLLYSTLIGIVSGLGACAFFFLLEWGNYFIQEWFAGYHAARPAGEHLVTLEAHTPFRPFLLFILPAIGGLLSGIIVYTWAPEAEGHGTDALIDAFHNQQGIVRTRIPYVKGIASIITMVSGGSAGREGPIAQIGAGFGSWVARALDLSVRERRLMLLAGCAAGLGAIFRAPLGGAIVAIEVLYREDFESEGIMLCIMSSVIAYALFTSIFGSEYIFATTPAKFTNPMELLFYFILGLVCVPFGFVYVRMFYGLRDRFFRLLPIKRALVPALGGIMVGLVGLWKPQALAGGYGTIQQALLGQLPVKLMLILAVLKIFSTSFTISSGGSGGVFGPSLFIGAMIGGAVGVVGHSLYPHIVPHAEPYALVGMGAFFAGVAKAPIGALLMVSEMTGGYGLVVPLMFTSVIAILLCQPWSIFEKQVPNRFQSPAHRTSMVINVLQRMKVSEVYNKDNAHSLLPQDMTLGNLREFVIRTNESFFPVVDEELHLKGILSLPQIRSVIFDEHLSDLLVVGELASPPFSTSMEESLYEALVKFIESGYWQIPIEDENLGVVGMLRLREVMRAYQQEIQSLGNE